MQKQKITESIFTQLKSDNLPTVVESLCSNCQQNGETRILLTKIPFFKQIIVTSFYCDNCGNKNTEVQFGGQLPDYGVEILFKVLNKTDLNRQIIVSQHAKIWVQELDLQMPKLIKPQITTIQGLLIGVQQDLLALQQERKLKQPQRYQQIRKFIQRLKQYSSGSKFPISLKIRDPSGNSNIKNPFAPKVDKNLHITSLPRTLEDLVGMGYSVENAQQQLKIIQSKKMGNKINFTKPFEQQQFMKYQPVSFDLPCHSCQMPGQMKMCQTSIPYFTDMIIMSFICQYCGAHSTETKNTGDVKDEGCLINLKCNEEADLKRDLFKSQTCKVSIPELELQLDYGTLGGVFTTVQGLIQKIGDHLDEQNPFADSDSAFHTRMQQLLNQLTALRTEGKPFTLILRDPFGHSFLQNPDHPNQDKRATRVMYLRSQEQNQMLGLTDMKTENYEKSDVKSTGSMKKSKDRKYSQGSVQSIQQLKNKQKLEQQVQTPTKTQQSHYPVKFTKQSPHKPKSEEHLVLEASKDDKKEKDSSK